MDPTKKELYTATRPSGVNVGDPLIFDGWSKIRSNDACNWILLQLVGPTTVGVKATGAGGVDELISTVSDDDILFGAFRVHVAGQVKFYHFLFLGATASGMKKGKASMYESGIFQVRHFKYEASIHVTEACAIFISVGTRGCSWESQILRPRRTVRGQHPGANSQSHGSSRGLNRIRMMNRNFEHLTFFKSLGVQRRKRLLTIATRGNKFARHQYLPYKKLTDD